jgi:hypothetical protein
MHDKQAIEFIQCKQFDEQLSHKLPFKKNESMQEVQVDAFDPRQSKHGCMQGTH